MVTRLQAQPVLETACQLGEGPRWSVRNSELVWVDIAGRTFWRWNPAGSSSPRPVPLLGEPTCVFETGEGDYLLAIDATVCSLEQCVRPREERTPLLSFDEVDLALARTNDGRVDPAGRMWLGTMARDVTTPRGVLYRCDPGEAVVMLSGLTISNGIGWNAGGDVMYHVDTPTGAVSRYRYDLATGSLADHYVLADIGTDCGAPDGLAVDADGGVWVALWGGGAAYRFDRTGRHTHTITVPEASYVTALAFGGADLDLLLITTAAPGDARRQAPHSGDVFAVSAPCPGIADHPVSTLPLAKMKGGTS